VSYIILKHPSLRSLCVLSDYVDFCQVLWQDANIANIVGGKGFVHLAKNHSRLPKARADKEHFLAGAVVNSENFAENGGRDVPRW
jgi:hypothetical protein